MSRASGFGGVEQRARRIMLVAVPLPLTAVARKLNLIMTHLGIHEPDVPGVVPQGRLAGRKIQAIEAYREATGVGPKEAEDAVELLAIGPELTAEDQRLLHVPRTTGVPFSPALPLARRTSTSTSATAKPRCSTCG
jgi:hypothetical protein